MNKKKILIIIVSIILLIEISVITIYFVQKSNSNREYICLKTEKFYDSEADVTDFVNYKVVIEFNNFHKILSYKSGYVVDFENEEDFSESAKHLTEIGQSITTEVKDNKHSIFTYENQTLEDDNLDKKLDELKKDGFECNLNK